MKTQAMDKAKTRTKDCLYPFKTLLFEPGYPSTEQFQPIQDANGLPAGVKARIAFDSRVRIAKVSGYAVGERRPHTLQLSPRIHLYDSWFCGLLMHSCDPNVFFDTTDLELWTVQPIAPGTLPRATSVRALAKLASSAGSRARASAFARRCRPAWAMWSSACSMTLTAISASSMVAA